MTTNKRHLYWERGRPAGVPSGWALRFGPVSTKKCQFGSSPAEGPGDPWAASGEGGEVRSTS
jgi:hypothetical protein